MVPWALPGVVLRSPALQRWLRFFRYHSAQINTTSSVLALSHQLHWFENHQWGPPDSWVPPGRPFKKESEKKTLAIKCKRLFIISPQAKVNPVCEHEGIRLVALNKLHILWVKSCRINRLSLHSLQGMALSIHTDKVYASRVQIRALARPLQEREVVVILLCAMRVLWARCG